ncbi:hypothetical protein RAZWK3B_11952 [Roseobacter sp. AzwK-3b]|uniref:putative toxin-antitoxin system toxin component, PIN family n=1 Tax=Roseobacter sp. AzwK-3b TaxID=351016 RepID=UPI000156A74A|nr:putative toxin-antitoxin system toxin component, PIN family [Roseobacter sp. AzwK-3b]EDM69609.1 hypothetical protein RAZWK3B_11952 [Roseobacter sp. AzwK-3b]
MRIVIDTNVIVGAMLREGGASREILRRCFNAELQPLIGLTLFLELEDVLKRQSLFETSRLTEEERTELFHAFLSVTIWVPIFYRWRPNLRDEADNHVLELAVAGNAECIITKNRRDFSDMDLQFNDIKIMTPADFLERGRTT